MKEQIDYSRQDKLFDPKQQKFKVTVAGIGSVGSFVALLLAKMGIKDITVYDFDVVEMGNIPAQIYRVIDTVTASGNEISKCESLSNIIKEFSDVEIKIKNIKIDEKTVIEPSLNEIFILCLDSFESRKIVYNKLRDYPCKIIDTRMGGEEFSIYVLDCDDKKRCRIYEKQFDKKPSTLKCGERSIVYTVTSIASEVCNFC